MPAELHQPNAAHVREYTHHGRAARATEMPVFLRYVILHHIGYGEPHYDLMFETGPDSPLVTIRLSDWPIGRQTRKERLPDHRRAYLTYEGPVSNNRGEVKRIASGVCSFDGQAVTLDLGVTVRVGG